MTTLLVLGATVFSNRAHACPGKDPATCAQHAATATAEGQARNAGNPAHCARRADLVGPGACSWTTEMVAQRVLEEGTPWSYVGRLVRSEEVLASKVAAPYTIGPDARIHVVANEILENVDATGRLELAGRLLDVDGTTYFVVTSAEPGNS